MGHRIGPDDPTGPLRPVTLPAREPTVGHTSALERLQKSEELARGGMGVVHRAYDPVLRRDVALKENLITSGRTAPRRFVNEALVTAQLDHPYIVPVYDGQLDADVDGHMAYSMKLVRGITLTERIAESRAARAAGSPARHLTLDALLDVFAKVCDAVTHAHERGVVHRDIKPDNVMVGEHGEVYLMDWGLAKLTDAEELDLPTADPMTLPGYALGTPGYMAPEQARGEPMGPGCDQYALGILLYEMIGAERLREPSGRLQADLEVAALGTVRPIVAVAGERPPRALAAIVAIALQPDPSRRYASVRELADDVRRFRADRPVRAMPDGALQRVQRWLSGHREATLLLVVALLVLLLGVGSALAVVTAGGAGAYATWSLERQQRLGDVLTQISARAASMSRAVALVESQVEAVAGASQALLEQGTPQEGKVLLAPSAFVDPALRPVDTAFSAAYQREVSTTWPDLVIAPDGDRTLAADEARRLVPVRHTMQRAHLLTRQRLDGLDAVGAERAWRDDAGPLRWAIVGTPSGLYLEMPGAHWNVKGFDPRVRPWYTLATETAPRWGNPYQEASSGMLLVACSMLVPRSGGGSQGVASLTVSFTYLIEKYLTPVHEAVRETFLVQEDGRMVVRSSQVLGQARHTDLDEVYAMPPFPEPALTEALGPTAGTVYADEGATLYVHHPLGNGWWFVAEVAPDLAAAKAP